MVKKKLHLNYLTIVQGNKTSSQRNYQWGMVCFTSVSLHEYTKVTYLLAQPYSWHPKGWNIKIGEFIGQKTNIDINSWCWN